MELILLKGMNKTPIYEEHIKLGAKIVDFHGWLMPIQYKGIVHEHMAVRNHAGIFDASHMGEFEIKGRDAYAFVQYLITNNLDKIGQGRAIYSPICNEQGGIVDDLIVYMFNRQYILLVVNSSNIDKDLRWIKSHAGTFSVKIEDISNETALLALQGPSSQKIMEKFMNKSLMPLKRFHFVKEGDMIISRTGYTGEDGFEIFVNKDKAAGLWNELVKLGAEPAGLGARDTLRMEKGYILYGNDADETITPLEANITWTVDFNKYDFIGKKTLMQIKPRKKLVFMEMIDKGIPRAGCRIMDADGRRQIGSITSGTYSPSLEKGIAMGYIDTDMDKVLVEIRGSLLKAKVKI